MRDLEDKNYAVWYKNVLIRIECTPLSKAAVTLRESMAKYSHHSRKVRDLDFNVLYLNFGRLCKAHDTNLLAEFGP